jgi:tetrapyrrole methylase family protein / MazG family protein
MCVSTESGTGQGIMAKDNTASLAGLSALIRKLRSPEGCPWDREQTSVQISRCLLDEAYEVVDAIESGTSAELKEELGDLLFLMLFLVDMAEEKGDFALRGVIEDVTTKMIRRHPHVFGQKTVSSAAEVKDNWIEIKKTIEGKSARGLLDGIPRSMPALRRAQRMTERAAAVGFDWSHAGQVMEKVAEELRELEAAVAGGAQAEITAEMGDVLLSIVNLCRFLHVEAENSLNGSLDTFYRRFVHIEHSLRSQGKAPEESSLAVMDRLWDEAKERDKDTTP